MLSERKPTWRPLVLFLGLCAAACNIDPYRLEFDGDAGLRDARPRYDASGPLNLDGGSFGRDGGNPQDGDGGTGCVGEAERCNQVDDDCDGVVDNGFNLQLDPANCGSCGNACDDAAANQRGSCVGGLCFYECLNGFLDCSATAPGCEYQCIKTNGGEEVCDGVDNDCDCQTDEGFATQSDVNNCGRCRNVCIALHGTPQCVTGECGVARCDDGFKDLDPEINGCEYQCPFFPPRVGDATCDGLDDDCDGVADEDVPGVGDACTTSGMGECRPGKNRCVNGQQVCQPDNGAVPELCDNKDNDCNGTIDNGFDKQNDPGHCGASCTMCSFPHAIPGCTAGVCRYIACEAGWADRFPDAQFPNMPGCDYQCTASGPEVCDGIDNDCDGLTDTADPDIIRPTASFCADRGPCANATLECRAAAAGCGDSTVAWRCVYGAGAEVDSCGNLVAQETRCDGVDNDCDSAVDTDAFPLKNQPCDDGALGICRATGTYICDPAGVTNPVICNLTTPGQPQGTEKCNGLDDDCDGTVDDGASDDMVQVATNLWIYQYEASRPDATATSVGSSTVRSCSRAGVQPWSLVTWTEANTACAMAGKTLCTEAQWRQACRGAANTLYPYGATYQPQFCNGNDFDPGCSGADDDAAQPTGGPHGCPTPAESRCVSTFGANKIFDMSGNLREWTSTSVTGGFKRIRGGAYDNIGTALSCDFDFWAQEEDTFFFNLGFRCCSTSAN